MVIHEIERTIPPDLQRMIQEFESAFFMPLGPGRSYRIDYGEDRTAFIRTLGESKCFAAESRERIVGLIEVALVTLKLPDGSIRPAAYFADIKVLPDAQRTISTGRLIARSRAWAELKTDIGFCVTMDGIPIKPPELTGRLGIPAFSAAGRLMVVRLPVTAGDGMRAEDERFLTSDEEGEELYRRLTRGRYAPIGDSPVDRSAEAPAWLVHPAGLACGRFEDRRKVRRLIADDGIELRPVYLACFAFQNPQAAIDLILAALRRAESLRYRAVRFCLPAEDLAMLQGALGPGVIQGNGGTIFATSAAKTTARWNLNASEI